MIPVVVGSSPIGHPTLKQPIRPAQKWLRPALTPKSRAGDAFIANVKAAVEQVQANRPGAAARRRSGISAPAARRHAPPALHLARISHARCAARRRRGSTAGCAAALRAFGEARDWDVFEATLGRTALRRPARVRGDAARRKARASARSAQFRFLADEVLAWACGRPWRARSEAGQPMEAFARGVLERAHRRLLEGAERVDWNDAPGRHRVRILVKRLRYGCECFAAAWPDAVMEPLLGELRGLQGILGELNDIDVQRRLLAELAAKESLQQAGARLRKLEGRERSLIGGTAPRLARLRGGQPVLARAGSCSRRRMKTVPGSLVSGQANSRRG